MRSSSRDKAILAVVGSQLIWGIAGPLVKIVLSTVPPFSLLFIRCLSATLILFGFYEFKWRFSEAVKTRQDKIDIFLAGFFGVFVNIALYFVGQNLTSVTDAWVITSSGTLFVIAYYFLFRNERLSNLAYSGIILAFIGTSLIVGNPLLAIGTGSFTGNLLMLGSTFGSVISYVLTKKLLVKFSPMVLTYYFFLISLVFSSPLFVFEFSRDPGWIARLPVSSYLIISYLILFSSVIAYALSNIGLVHLSASAASTLGYISSAVAVLLSIVFLHEKLSWYFFAGTLFIAIGLFLAETRHPTHPLHRLYKKFGKSLRVSSAS